MTTKCKTCNQLVSKQYGNAQCARCRSRNRDDDSSYSGMTIETNFGFSNSYSSGGCDTTSSDSGGSDGGSCGSSD